MLTSSFLERRLRYGLMVYGLHLTSLAIIEASCRVAGLETTLASVLQPLAPIRGGSLPPACGRHGRTRGPLLHEVIGQP